MHRGVGTCVGHLPSGCRPASWLRTAHPPPPGAPLLFQEPSHPRAHTSPEIPAALCPQWGPEREHREGEGRHAHFMASRGGPCSGLPLRRAAPAPGWPPPSTFCGRFGRGEPLTHFQSRCCVLLVRRFRPWVPLAFLTPHSAARGLYTRWGCGPGHLSGSPVMASSPVPQRGQY